MGERVARRSLLLAFALPLAFPLSGAAGARPNGLALYEHHARDAGSVVVTFTVIDRGAAAIAGVRVCKPTSSATRVCRRVGALTVGEAFTFELRLPRAASSSGRGWVESAGATRLPATRV